MLATEESATTAKALSIRCPSCGTEQALVDAGERDLCVICSRPLFATALAIPPADDPKAEPVGRLEMAALAVEISEEILATPPPEQLSELLAVNKRLTSLFTLIPLWGPLRLLRSASHTSREKCALISLSMMLTIALFVGAFLARPSAAERASATRGRIESQIEALHALVESYAAQHPGEWVDENVWQRSAQAGDLRFYDPWGRLYRYQPEGSEFVIGTYGSDGAEGGDGEAADILFRFQPSPPALPARSPEELERIRP
jgi:hypothetical protein